MALTAFGTNDPRTQQKWSKKEFKWLLGTMWFGKLMGATPNAVIQVNSELKDETGDKITFDLEKPLTGTGNGNDGRVVNNTEKLSVLNFRVAIGERSHGVVAAGKISAKRTATKIVESGKRQLRIWLAGKQDRDIMRAMCGLVNEAGIATVNVKAPSTARRWVGGQNTAGTVFHNNDETTINALGDADATDYLDYLFGTRVIKSVKLKAMMCDPEIRPVQVVNADETYHVMLIHPYQASAIKDETAWINAQKDGGVRGKKNRIFTGAIGMFDGVIIHVYKYLPLRAAGVEMVAGDGDAVNANVPAAGGVARAMFMGAQAGAFAYGQKPQSYMENIDVGRIPITAVDVLYGVSKTQFKVWDDDAQSNTAQEDFGSITVDTCVVVS